MSSQKRNRLIAAATVNVVLLLFILVGIMVYQLVTIFVLNKNKTDIEEQITYYSERIDTMSEDIEYYQTVDGLLHLIVKYGLYKT